MTTNLIKPKLEPKSKSEGAMPAGVGEQRFAPRRQDAFNPQLQQPSQPQTKPGPSPGAGVGAGVGGGNQSPAQTQQSQDPKYFPESHLF